MKLLDDLKDIFRKDWKLFLLVNAVYFGMIALGALLALAVPGLQLSMISASGQTFATGGVYESVGQAYTSGNIPIAAVFTFLVNFFPGTLLMLVLPSLILPVWALLFGAFRALLWGIMLVVPVPGVLPLSVLASHYLTLVLEGEAYIVAMFACTRGMVALLKPKSFGTDSRVQAYKRSVVDTGKLLLVVALILAVAATYEAIEVTLVAGATGGVTVEVQDRFFEEEFGKDSLYSDWTQTIQANASGWTTFGLDGGKLSRVRFVTDGNPVDVIVLDKANYTAYETGSEEWSACLIRKDTTNTTFDFTPPADGVYWFVLENNGERDAAVHAQLRSMK